MQSLNKRGINRIAMAVALTSSMVPAVAVAQSGNPDQAMGFDSMSEQDQRDFCEGVAQTAQSVSQELPIQVDRTTTLVGSEAAYQEGKCIYFLDYVVDEPGVFEVTYQQMKEADTTLGSRAETMAFIKQFYATGSEGYQEFRNNLRKQLMSNEQFARFAAVPFLELRASYELDGDQVMDDISIVMGRDGAN